MRCSRSMRSCRLAGLACLLFPLTAHAAEPVAFDALSGVYRDTIRPLLKSFCLDCHSTELKEGELELERFNDLPAVRRAPEAWQKVAEMLDNGEMPPAESPQPSAEQRKQLRAWVGSYLRAEALAGAGDPGRVVLRRLNNAEYTYTIRDLTGVPLDPAREFPADGAAGEGFTNTGNALAMSPALVEKYFQAGKEISNQLVLLPDGFRFSAGETRRDWTNEYLAEIRAIYLRHTATGSKTNLLDRWDVLDPKRATEEDGRIDLAKYLAALLTHRERLRDNLDAAAEIARDEHLNPKYLRILAEFLTTDAASSPLLEHIRSRWRNADVGSAERLAAEIRAWQTRVWKFNSVGHFGGVRPWQEAVDPLAASQEFRIKLPDGGPSLLTLAASTARDGDHGDLVVWNRPRLERPGMPPLALRNVRAAVVALERLRAASREHAANYLHAAFELRGRDKTADVAAIIAAHRLDPRMARVWFAWLGVEISGPVKVDNYLRQALQNVGGHTFVHGWGMPGLGDLSVLSNASDQPVKIPGDLNPRQVVVHPRPERWVAAGWRSPIDGVVSLAPRVRHAHPNCGNGVSWSLEWRRGLQRKVLASGNLDLGGATAQEPLQDFSVRRGDLVSLIIGPRDANHSCDLTEIDLTIVERDGETQRWSLASDCADDLAAGNPHADRLGNEAVWHFYAGTIDANDAPSTIPPGSLLARWLETTDRTQAAELARQIESLAKRDSTDGLNEPDAALWRQLTDYNGPLFAPVDLVELSASLSGEDLSDVPYGVDPVLFGSLSEEQAAAPDRLTMRAPGRLAIRFPEGMFAGAELVVSGELDAASGGEGSVQLQVVAGPETSDELLPGTPIVVAPGSAAEARWKSALADFRALFPATFCYPQIVPVDEVVTLVLFHREDEPLRRLMLNDAERARLDRLWDELHYVGRDALTIVTAYEQLMEFATQDADPRVFEPLRNPINERAEAFRQRIISSERAHLDALYEFASRAYRRPLRDEERESLTRLYRSLREEGMEHEAAVRLTLARVLTAPAFLYRLETPGPGTASVPVNDWELATRLSYFLRSSLPDEELRRAAGAGTLHQPDVLRAQLHRLLQSDDTRRLAIEFACQWLHIRDFDALDEKSERHFPEFAELRGAMYEESILFFADLFQRDGSILDILDADHTFLNEKLASHYGIPGVAGEAFRRVEGVKLYRRGGILGLATTLAKQSGASRTSPILRGNWVSESLLGERLPRPPKDVPLLPESETEIAGLSVRQLVERHASDAACAKCHRRIDPYGFALENFDAIGRHRERDANGRPFDLRATVMDGTPIDGIDGLRTYLLTVRQETFVRQFCRKLLGYALGRGVQLSDEPLLDEIVATLQVNEYRFGAAVEMIVLSRQFREIRGKDAADRE